MTTRQHAPNVPRLLHQALCAWRCRLSCTIQGAMEATVLCIWSMTLPEAVYVMANVGHVA
jgi:hypothetical protein